MEHIPMKSTNRSDASSLRQLTDIELDHVAGGNYKTKEKVAEGGEGKHHHGHGYFRKL
jgi:hypothetical protein